MVTVQTLSESSGSIHESRVGVTVKNQLSAYPAMDCPSQKLPGSTGPEAEAPR